jgi:hypothetical protein
VPELRQFRADIPGFPFCARKCWSEAKLKKTGNIKLEFGFPVLNLLLESKTLCIQVADLKDKDAKEKCFCFRLSSAVKSECRK